MATVLPPEPGALPNLGSPRTRVFEATVNFARRDRFQVRDDARGYTVFDIWTGAAVVIDGVPQTGRDIEDAGSLAALLSQWARQGALKVFV